MNPTIFCIRDAPIPTSINPPEKYFHTWKKPPSMFNQSHPSFENPSTESNRVINYRWHFCLQLASRQAKQINNTKLTAFLTEIPHVERCHSRGHVGSPSFRVSREKPGNDIRSRGFWKDWTQLNGPILRIKNHKKERVILRPTMLPCCLLWLRLLCYFTYLNLNLQA